MKSIPTSKREDEGTVVTFTDVLDFIMRKGTTLIGLSLAGVVIGIGVTFLIPKQWESTGVLQIGQVASETASAPGAPTLIEPTQRALERLRIPQFTDDVLKILGHAVGPDEDAAAALARRSFKSTLLAATDLIQFTVRGYSPEDATRTANAIGNELARIHAGLMRPSLDRLNADMEEVSQGVIREDKRREMLNDLVTRRDQLAIAGKFSENVLLSEMVNENEKSLRALRLRKNTLHADFGEGDQRFRRT